MLRNIRMYRLKGGGMKVVVNVEMPMEPFNSMVRAGTAGAILGEILETLQPESAYFYAPNGRRGGTLIVDVSDPPRIFPPLPNLSF